MICLFCLDLTKILLRHSFVMIHEFDVWAAGSSETNPFSDLKGSVLAIEASFYLERLLTQAPFKEPLLSALGGVPFALKAHIQNELELLRNADITPLFVFGGMNTGEKDRPFRQQDNAVRLNSNAWQLYDEHQAQRAVDTFGSSGDDDLAVRLSRPLLMRLRIFATRRLLPSLANHSARTQNRLPNRTIQCLGPGSSHCPVLVIFSDGPAASVPGAERRICRCDRWLVGAPPIRRGQGCY